jgi:hypothetical protein
MAIITASNDGRKLQTGGNLRKLNRFPIVNILKVSSIPLDLHKALPTLISKAIEWAERESSYNTRTGSVSAFLLVYLQQIVTYGYQNAPLEVDARDHETSS